MHRIWAGTGAVHAFIAVAAGAFGAHALKSSLEPNLLAAFETGARYQLFHALGLFAVAFLVRDGLDLDRAGWALNIGTALFSGSLYVLALSGIRGFGAVTPFGGLTLLGGWALIAWRCLRG